MISVKDNDSLSSLLSVELKADLLLMLSDVQGIYSGPPDLPESRLLDTFRPTDVSNIEFGDKSRVGRGGMESKVKVYALCLTLQVRYVVNTSSQVLVSYVQFALVECF